MASRRRPRALAAAGSAALLAGCAAWVAPLDHPASASQQRPDPVAQCARLYQRVDAAVAAAGVADAQSARIARFPYLRINRFLADSVPAAGDAASFDFWVQRLRRLDARARNAELANLPSGSRFADSAARLQRCAATLLHHDLADPDNRIRLRTASVPDDYQPLQRVLGLYPLTSMPFLLGVRRLHDEIRETFATPLASLPVAGSLRRLRPPAPRPLLSADEVAGILQRAADNPLRIPVPTGADLERLFRAFAPHWEIDVASADDRPGRLVLSGGTAAEVTGSPVVYTTISHARWQQHALLQLNYVIWFPARPRQGPLDLVGGHLDGLTWRVTLGPNGRPLLYDAMHNCGCYYMAFSTPRVQVDTRRRGWEEPLVIPQTVPDGSEALTIRLQAGTHYVQRVYRRGDAGEGEAYELADYDRLRSLPLQDGGRRSLFRPDGIVEGTQRRERWLFWPMGVPEPGAMRQMGNHAIAFVGRRHFDDPRLLERYFAPE
ncbi:MAG: hypothetical protein U5Q16_05990 [Gammaproteobacteria bacterium]|nr:hypothetical protein [Gammaproteobacteria bacterium]